MDIALLGQILQLGIGAVSLVILWQLWLAYIKLQEKLIAILERLAALQEQAHTQAVISREGTPRQG